MLVLARTAAQTAWLGRDAIVVAFLLSMATLGYLPFRHGNRG